MGDSVEIALKEQKTDLEKEGAREHIEQGTFQPVEKEPLDVHEADISFQDAIDVPIKAKTEQETNLKVNENLGKLQLEKNAPDMEVGDSETISYSKLDTQENVEQLTDNDLRQKNGDNKNIIGESKSESGGIISKETHQNDLKQTPLVNSTVKKHIELTKRDDNVLGPQTLLHSDLTTVAENEPVSIIDKKTCVERKTDISETCSKDNSGPDCDINSSETEISSKSKTKSSSEKNKKRRSTTKKKNTKADDIDIEKKPKFGLTPEMIEEEKKLKEQQAIELNEIKEKVKISLFFSWLMLHSFIYIFC